MADKFYDSSEINRKNKAAELARKEDEQNELLRKQAQDYKKQHGTFEGFFQKTPATPEEKRKAAFSSLKKAMTPEKVEEDSPLAKIVKHFKGAR